jgi:RNA polymerase sigma-70 factor
MAQRPLAAAFVAARGLTADEDDAALQAALSDLCAAARTAHPTLAHEPIGFVGHLGAAGFDVVRSAAQAADCLLAWRCLCHDPAALAVFEKRHVAEVPGWLRRFQASPAQVDEVQQLLRERLFVAASGTPRIAAYDGRVPLGAWVRVVALRIAFNRWRAERASPVFESPSGVAARAISPDARTRSPNNYAIRQRPTPHRAERSLDPRGGG